MATNLIGIRQLDDTSVRVKLTTTTEERRTKRKEGIMQGESHVDSAERAPAV